jgi:hypothetical protein
MAELLGTPTKVDPGFRGGFSGEPAHGAEKAIGPDLDAEAMEASNNDRVFVHPPTWRVQSVYYT